MLRSSSILKPMLRANVLRALADDQVMVGLLHHLAARRATACARLRSRRRRRRASSARACSRNRAGRRRRRSAGRRSRRWSSSGSSSTMLTPAISASSTSSPCIISANAVSTQVFAAAVLEPVAVGRRDDDRLGALAGRSSRAPVRRPGRRPPRPGPAVLVTHEFTAGNPVGHGGNLLTVSGLRTGSEIVDYDRLLADAMRRSHRHHPRRRANASTTRRSARRSCRSAPSTPGGPEIFLKLETAAADRLVQDSRRLQRRPPPDAGAARRTASGRSAPATPRRASRSPRARRARAAA